MVSEVLLFLISVGNRWFYILGLEWPRWPRRPFDNLYRTLQNFGRISQFGNLSEFQNICCFWIIFGAKIQIRHLTTWQDIFLKWLRLSFDEIRILLSVKKHDDTSNTIPQKNQTKTLVASTSRRKNVVEEASDSRGEISF